MISLTFSLLSLIALSVAQNHTVSLFLPAADLQSLVGSIVGGDATATTYVVQCANGGSNGAAATSAAATSAAATSLAAATSVGPSLEDDGDACGFPIPVTVTEGPSTVAYSIVADDSTLAISCQLSGTSVAVCTAIATGAILSQVTVPTSTATTLSGTDVSYLPVVITAGSVTNTASTGASTTSSGGSTSATGAGKGGSTSSTSGTNTQTGSTTGASTKASGAAIHLSPAMGMGAAGAVAAVAAFVL